MCWCGGRVPAGKRRTPALDGMLPLRHFWTVWMKSSVTARWCIFPSSGRRAMITLRGGICSIKFQKEATLLYHIGYGRAAFKENSMNANVNYCSIIILLRQLVAAGHCTKKEANRIAARIARKTGADLILSI